MSSPIPDAHSRARALQGNFADGESFRHLYPKPREDQEISLAQGSQRMALGHLNRSAKSRIFWGWPRQDRPATCRLTM